MKIKSTYKFLFLIAAVLGLGACAASQDTVGMKELVGQVIVVGNEPFTDLALQVNPSLNYILDCNSKTRETLLGNQGKWVRIYFNKIGKKNNLTTIEVEKAQILTKE